MNSHLPSLTVLRRDSRFWLEFHGKAQNSHGKFTLQSFSKTRLLCIGCWFHSLIFKLVVFSTNQTSNLHSQFHKATNEGEKKKVSSTANTINKKWRCTSLASLISWKTISSMIENFLCVLKMVSLCTFLHEIIVFFWSGATTFL